MVDTEKLVDAIRQFERSTSPHSATVGDPATVDDINKLRKGIVTVLQEFVRELS